MIDHLFEPKVAPKAIQVMSVRKACGKRGDTRCRKETGVASSTAHVAEKDRHGKPATLKIRTPAFFSLVLAFDGQGAASK
jgi:hypothetical protein